MLDEMYLFYNEMDIPKITELYSLENLENYELDPALVEALSKNILIEDCFYLALNEGDLEMAEFYARIAFDLNDVDIEEFADSTYYDELDHYEIDEANDVYEVADAMELWECQGETERCAQYAQLFVIEEALDIKIDPDEFCEFSQQNGWFDEEGGTSLENMTKMLDYYGIENELSQGKSFEDMLSCLENGGRVIVAVDSGEYWEGEGAWEDLYNPYGADHAIEVIGYDEQTNCVIVNDSGIPNGCGIEIPAETFINAWEDSGNTMVECFNIKE